MNSNKCLYCYNELNNSQIDYHEKCCKKFFGTATPPELNINLNELENIAENILGKSIALTGVQPKLSLEEEKRKGSNTRLTIVGLWGKYILKPPVQKYPQMPELEDLTMHLAEVVKIKTAPHTLIKLASGELAYLSKRFDRTKNGDKLPVEDMAQLTGTLTERKYKSSMEKIGKAITQYSSYPGNDLLTFFELTIFSFITGNADMHLKNFSLIGNDENEYMFSPAYDLLATKLLIPQDEEEMALPLNGKKSRLRKNDFLLFGKSLNIPDNALLKVFERLNNSIGRMNQLIDKSFIDLPLKDAYKNLIADRINRIN